MIVAAARLPQRAWRAFEAGCARSYAREFLHRARDCDDRVARAVCVSAARRYHHEYLRLIREALS